MMTVTTGLFQAEEMFIHAMSAAVNLIDWLAERNEELSFDLKRTTKYMQERYYKIKSKRGQMGDHITASAVYALTKEIVDAHNRMCHGL